MPVAEAIELRRAHRTRQRLLRRNGGRRLEALRGPFEDELSRPATPETV